MPRYSRTTKIFRYVLIASIVAVLLALLSWYFFLRSQESALFATDTARGTGVAPPSFGGLFGSTYENITANTSDFEAGASASSTAITPRLWQITKTPVAGAGFMSSTAEASSTIRFVERGTGYVLEAEPGSGKLARLTNTLVPRVYEALIGENGAVILRGVNDAGFITTSAGLATSTMATSKDPSALNLSILPQNIQDIVLSPNGEKIVYLLREEDGRASIVQSMWNGMGSKRLATLGVSGWQMRWLSDARIFLTQNPAEGIVNNAYELKKDGALSRVLSGANGLVILPRENSSAYLSSSAGFILSARTNPKASTITLPIRTTADKCVWSPNEEFVAYCAVPQILPEEGALAARLRGEMHTSDSWWRVDVNASRVELLYAPGNMLQIDVENPSVDANGEYIAFMNARDKSLWLLRIAE